MVRKHIIRNKDNSIKQIQHIGADDEYIMFEVFGTDHKNTSIFTLQKNNIRYSNAVQKNRLGLPTLISPNINPMNINVGFSVEAGMYSIEIIYEQNSKLHKENKIPVNNAEKYDSSKDLLGSYIIHHKSQNSTSSVKVIDRITDNMPETVKKQIEKINNRKMPTSFNDVESPIKFDGENNINKRAIIYEDLAGGDYELTVKIPSNCYFKGMILRKVIRYWGTNTEEVGTNVFIKKITMTDTEMSKPREAKVVLDYDDIFESHNNPNGFAIGYGDECNITVKNSEGNISQIFGGYVDDITKNNETFELNCKDRLADTEKRYIMDYLTVQGGTKQDIEHPNKKDFGKYGEMLKYLCDICELTLKNNIPFNYWISGEKHDKGHIITFGKKKDIRKISVTNGIVTVHNNSIVLRNNESGLKKQVFNLYSTKNPVKLNGNVNGHNMHITLGMGNPKTSQEIKETVDVSMGDQMAGAVKWSKCGVSPNKDYVMGIGQKSAGKTSDKYLTGFWKGIFKNECPYCKKKGVLRWDSGRTDTKCIFSHGWNGTKRNWAAGGIPETQITCTNCDMDFDAVSGWEKINGSNRRLDIVKIGLKSSKHEQDLLHDGKLTAPVKGNVKISAEEVFKAVKNSVKGFKHRVGTGSTASYLEKYHVGDCWAWSEKIKKELMKYKVNCKIVEYSADTSNHRSVLYQNSKGEYVDFPYREYGFPKGTYNTSGSKKGTVVDKYTSGGRISQAVSGGNSTTKTETRKITVTKGYDINVPIKGYFDIIFSAGAKNSKKHHVFIDFTLNSKSRYAIGSFKPVFVNNSIKRITFKDIINKIKSAYSLKDPIDIWLYGINFITPKMDDEEIKNKSSWYTNDETTRDNSSCKMILYNISFDDKDAPDPAEYESCGKTVNDLFNTIVKEGNFLMDVTYGRHRCDDVVNFRVNNNINPSFYATDKSNILNWNNINYNANNSLFNKSVCVFKSNADGKYYYIERCDIGSMLLYHEKPSLETVSDETSVSEAYWNVRHNVKYNPTETCEYGITVIGFPDVKLEDLISVDSDNDKLDDVKVLKSISMTYDPKTRPSIRTELGLNEKADDLNVRDIIKNIKDRTLRQDTSFKSSALPITDENIYIWDY